MISKELLSEVLCINVTEIYIHKKQGYKFKTKSEKNGWASTSDAPIPNIYELAHKCKEWALTEGFIIYSSCKSASIYKDLEYLYGASNEPTEPEAIFKACQWILDN